MSLKARLQAQIRAFGPISVAQYMGLCLHDPKDGYYGAHPKLGADGDFLTAPLISQMFGELLGLWAIAVWESLGRPERLSLIEIGPGDGTLISDLLRAVRLAPQMVEGLEVILVETSAPLTLIQQKRLASAPIRWARRLDEVTGEGPVILIANEVLDCLPARQFIRTPTGWAERMVGLTDEGDLTFGLSPRPVEELFPPAPQGAVLELSAAQEALSAEVGALIARRGGAALLIDYGRETEGFGDTLQALKNHQKHGPLDHPGEDDLTIHADFPAVLKAARAEGVQTAITAQGAFLQRLGIVARAQALAHARPDQAETIQRQLVRLIASDQMGDLFKVAGLWSKGLPQPPGFSADPKDHP
jgi:NADH dehydrogenase [ubiquinone] 1 alpha subcomplex assembly factor 7